MPRTRGVRSHDRQILRGILRDLRLQAGLTQTTLARRLRKPQSYVSKYENGERRLDGIELRQVCLACGSTLIDLAKRFERELQTVS